MLHIGVGSLGKANSASREALTERVLESNLLSIEYFQILKRNLPLTTI